MPGGELMATLNLWPSVAPAETVALIEATLKRHRLDWGYTVDQATCECGWQVSEPAFEKDRKRQHRHHVAEVIASLGGVA
jgi:hypothetical protein